MTDGQEAWQHQPPPQQWMQHSDPNQHGQAQMNYQMDPHHQQQQQQQHQQQPQYMQQPPQYQQPPPLQQPSTAPQYQAAPMPPVPAPVVVPPDLSTAASRRARKANRDPGAPKRNMSAYLLYQNGMREQFKAQNPGMSFGQLSKYTSAMYAQLTPEEKGAWQHRAEADKARYEYELSQYVPPPGYDQRGEQIVATMAVHPTIPVIKKPTVAPMVPSAPVVAVSTKRHKDVNAPKKNVSAYLLYQNAMRDKFKRDNPGMSFGQLSKYTSHMYKNLSTEEKAAWEQVAQQDKQRYEAEMAAYQPPPGHDARGVFIAQQGASYNPSTAVRKRKRTKGTGAPKRNKGSFVYFAEEERPRIKAEFPDVKFTDMGVILGQRWRSLSADRKLRYEHLANQDKIRFAHEMAEYNRVNGLPSDNKSARPKNSVAAPPPAAGHHHYPPQAAHNPNGGGYGDPSMTMYQNHQPL